MIASISIVMERCLCKDTIVERLVATILGYRDGAKGYEMPPMANGIAELRILYKFGYNLGAKLRKMKKLENTKE